MMHGVPRLQPTLFALLPESLHWTGEPTDWVRVTRPGQRLHSFLEGACFDGTGTLWLVDVPYGRIFRIGPGRHWELAQSYEGEPHGLKRFGDGFALVDYRHGLMTFDPATGGTAVLATGINTERFRGLSDLAVAADGDIWFTDSGRTSLSDPTGRLFRRRVDGRLDLVLANLPYPNGVALSPDGRFVYVAATRANAVWRLLADAPDPVWPMVGVFLHLSGGLGPDGLAVDADGRIAVAQAQAGRVYLFDASGDPLAEIRLPDPWTTSVAFGPDQHLYIVEARQGAVWRVSLEGLAS